MDDIANSIVEFINQQSPKTKDKYITFVEAAAVQTDETYMKLIDSNFTHNDYKILVAQVSKIIIDKFPFETVLHKIK